jgi:hypothetical protein
MKIVIAKYTENDYALVQKTLPDAFPTLEQHIEAISAAALQLTEQGYNVVFEPCDASGYFAFLRRNNARHCRQNVAAYVNAKNAGIEQESFEQLNHQNITIIKN